LDGSLNNLVQLKMSLLTARGLGWMTSNGPFQPKAFNDSINLWVYDGWGWPMPGRGQPRGSAAMGNPCHTGTL